MNNDKSDSKSDRTSESGKKKVRPERFVETDTSFFKPLKEGESKPKDDSNS